MPRLWTYEARGNAFLMLAACPGADGPALARRLCREARPGGTDGLLALTRADGGLAVRMWNPDGTEDFCGNGIACAVHLAHFLGWGRVRSVATPLGPVPARLLAPATSRVVGVTLRPPVNPLRGGSGGTARWPATRVTLGTRGVTGYAVSPGSPHFVILCESLPDSACIATEGPALESHGAFDERMNVTWCAIRRDGLHTRFWERGVGETAGCGTGAVAAAVVAIDLGHSLGPVRVSSPGGQCKVGYAAGGAPRLVTPVRRIGSALFAAAPAAPAPGA